MNAEDIEKIKEETKLLILAWEENTKNWKKLANDMEKFLKEWKEKKNVSSGSY